MSFQEMCFSSRRLRRALIVAGGLSLGMPVLQLLQTIRADEFTAPARPTDSVVQPTDSAASSTGQNSATTLPNHARRELPEQGIQFIRGIALLLMPESFDDEDGWGRETRIQSGLDVDFDDGRIETKRRWKSVNHGSWLQGAGQLVDPETTFSLKATQLPDPDAKTQAYLVQASARLRVTGRQQQWNYGVMLWSLSADAVADIRLDVTLNVKADVVTTDKGSRLRFQPSVTQAQAHLTGFSLRRVSHAKGAMVREFGNWLEELLRLRLKRENKDLAARINKALSKKSDQLEIPLDLGSWFSEHSP